MNVLTVVVTFNRYDLLAECLDALLRQTRTTTILVVDNASTDNTNEKIKEDGYLEHSNLIYTRLEYNLGGAGGFYYGVQYAQEKEYDYVWLMDDDAEPALDGLEILMNNLDEGYCAYAPSTYIGTKSENHLSTYGHRGVFDYYNSLPSFQKPIDMKLYEQDKIEIEMASFVGIFIPMSSVEKIGLPREDFFIHYDDTEYSLRLARLGKILMIKDSKIYHKEKRQEEKIQREFLFLKKNRIKFERLWLKYFGLRNSVYLTLVYGRGWKRYFHILNLYVQLIKDIVLYDDHKWIRLKFATSSILDGVTGTFDNSKPTKILGKN